MNSCPSCFTNSGASVGDIVTSIGFISLSLKPAARDEKEYQTAATIYGAAQAVVTEKYAKDSVLKKGTITQTNSAVLKLAGVDANAVSTFSFSYGSNYIITGGKVKIGGSTYKLTISDKGVPTWTAGKNVT